MFVLPVAQAGFLQAADATPIMSSVNPGAIGLRGIAQFADCRLNQYKRIFRCQLRRKYLFGFHLPVSGIFVNFFYGHP